MMKPTLMAAALFVVATTPAFADNRVWNVTEESPQGLKVLKANGT